MRSSKTLRLFLAGKVVHGLERHLAHPAPVSSNNAPAFDSWLAARLVVGLFCRWRWKFLFEAWEEAKRRFPRLLVKVNEKRLRRIEYVLATGKLPPSGWTPPDPKNRSTQNIPPYVQFWKH